MKVAELFAELGFKIEGEDELLRFEKSLEGIAQAARNAALALKDLAQSRIPKAITIRAGAAPAAAGASPSARLPLQGNYIPSSSPNFIGPVQPAAYSGAAPPKLQPMPNSVLQGLRSLGMLGLKVLGIGTLALALKKLVSALVDMISASMRATFAVDKFTTKTGISRAELKNWEHIAALSDVKAEQLQETLEGLQQRSRQIRFTGEGATPFLQLGIDAMASPTQILRQFAQRTKQMDAATAVFFGGLIGISDDVVYMLRKNADKLDTLFPNTSLDDPQYKAITSLNTAWKELTFNLSALKDKITSDLAPAITWVLDQITMWARLATISKDVRSMILSPNPALILPMIRGALGGSTSKVENNVEVNVNGSDSPKETARETGKAVGRVMSDAYFQQFPANAAL